MAITVADNFQYLGGKPLDSRLKFNSISAMVGTSASSLYDGCLAYVTAEKTYYSYDSTNEIDEALGKWRELSTGGGGGGGELPVLYDETGIAHIIGKVVDGEGVTKDLYRSISSGIFSYITPAGIFGSSWYDDNERPEEAFNGNMNDGWLPASTTNPSYAGIHLSDAVVFGKCEVYISSKGRDSSDWMVQGSNDGTNWTTISTTVHPSASGTHTMTSTSSDSYTYLRFYTSSGLCPSGSGGEFTRINEIKFYSPNILNLEKIYNYEKTYYDANLYLIEYTITD